MLLCMFLVMTKCTFTFELMHVENLDERLNEATSYIAAWGQLHVIALLLKIPVKYTSIS